MNDVRRQETNPTVARRPLPELAADTLHKGQLQSESLENRCLRIEGKRPKLTVLTADYVNEAVSVAGARFQGRSSSMRLMGWSAMRVSTSRKYASGSMPLSLAVPIRL